MESGATANGDPVRDLIEWFQQVMSEGAAIRKREYRSAVTILGAGDFSEGDLWAAIELAPVLVCADGAANRALELGLEPDLVIGDLDSISTEARERLSGSLVHITDQGSTDFDKCLSCVVAPLIVCVGFTGFRLDHQLAALASLARFATHPALMVTPREVCFRAPASLDMPVPRKTTVSLFPFGRVSARSKGLKWPLDGLELHPSGTIGTSNVTTSSRLEIQVEHGNLLVILPRRELEAVMQVLSQ